MVSRILIIFKLRNTIKANGCYNIGKFVDEIHIKFNWIYLTNVNVCFIFATVILKMRIVSLFNLPRIEDTFA